MSDQLRRELDTVRDRYRAAGENASRKSTVTVSHNTVGPGETALTAPLMFGITFTEEPAVAVGYILHGNPKRDDFPEITAFLWGKVWAVNDRGHYIGFYPAFRVGADTQYKIEHVFTFTGTALKPVGSG